jgi:hypothetical protein
MAISEWPTRDLTNVTRGPTAIHWPNLWEIAKDRNMINNLISHPDRCTRIIRRNVTEPSPTGC